MGGKQDCSKLCPNCTKSLYNHQRRVGPGIQQKPRIWTLISLIIYDFSSAIVLSSGAHVRPLAMIHGQRTLQFFDGLIWRQWSFWHLYVEGYMVRLIQRSTRKDSPFWTADLKRFVLNYCQKFCAAREVFLNLGGKVALLPTFPFFENRVFIVWRSIYLKKLGVQSFKTSLGSKRNFVAAPRTSYLIKKKKCTFFWFSGHVLAEAIVTQSSLGCYFWFGRKRNTLGFI